MMRIVGGIYRGRRLEAPGGQGTRPTSDRVREALMSSLYSLRGGPLDGASVLDAFAGTGALGLEALSRGAARAVFYDTARQAVAAVKRNIAVLGVSAREAQVVSLDVFAAAEQGHMPGAPYDLVFLDPPYAVDAAQVAALLRSLAGGGSLAPGALAVYEHGEGRSGAKSYDAAPIEDLCADPVAGFSLVADKRYAKTAVTILRYR